MNTNQRGFGIAMAVCVLTGLAVLGGAGWLWVSHSQNSAQQFTTPYQAVLLTNGAVYFGHLNGFGGTRPVLTDVYYIASRTNPQTKEVSNVLVKRGKELHEPDSMYLNSVQILFVEPVGTNSKVAQLIAQAK